MSDNNQDSDDLLGIPPRENRRPKQGEPEEDSDLPAHLAAYLGRDADGSTKDALIEEITSRDPPPEPPSTPLLATEAGTKLVLEDPASVIDLIDDYLDYVAFGLDWVMKHDPTTGFKLKQLIEERVAPVFGELDKLFQQEFPDDK